MVAEGSHHAQASFYHPISYQNHHRNDLKTYFLATAQDELHSGSSTQGNIIRVVFKWIGSMEIPGGVSPHFN